MKTLIKALIFVVLAMTFACKQPKTTAERETIKQSLDSMEFVVRMEVLTRN